MATDVMEECPTYEPPPRICKKGGYGLILPLTLGWEQEQEWWIQAILYFFALIWFFLGIAIVSDTFMGAIEKITSTKKLVKDKATGKFHTVKVWNATVANLTLMALGSSAPEILLNVIEVLGTLPDGMFAGDLGASVIVGSGAFNLLIIIAVCVVAIPDGDIRKIRDLNVYLVTASMSILAYVWLYVIVSLNTPKKIDVWEGAVTFACFPLLVILAYCADVCTSRVPRWKRKGVPVAEMTKDEQIELAKEIREKHGHVDHDTMKMLMACETAVRPSRAQYSIASKRRITGMKGGVDFAAPHDKSGRHHHFLTAQTAKMAHGLHGIHVKRHSVMEKHAATFSFDVQQYIVMECEEQVVAQVKCSTHLSTPCYVSYKTAQGTAKQDVRYMPTEGVLCFKPPEVTVLDVPIQIIDDDEWQDTEEFYLELFDPRCEPGVGTAAIDHKRGRTTITVLNDDKSGALGFEEDFLRVPESQEDSEIKVKVRRVDGWKGEVSCKYRTEEASATAGADFVAVENMLTLESGQVETTIPITIKAASKYEQTEQFRVVLYEPVGCKFEKCHDGNSEEQTCTIEIVATHDHHDIVDRVVNVLGINMDKTKLGTDSWKEQFHSVIFVGGSWEEQKEATGIDVFFHVITLPWKFVFAFIPPTHFAGGWFCFVACLIFLAGITAIVGDLAALFGCALGVPDELTAITFVALGTSLPDTFASRTAALHDTHADASVGNVTGSNSVNVFLGLGMPWSIAAIYWAVRGPTCEWKGRYPDLLSDYPDGGFAVESSGLAFSVGVFCTCAAFGLCFLALRRRLYGGELGGPTVGKWISGVFLVALWLVYIGASWLYIGFPSPGNEIVSF